jgi:lipid-A-disaccharide synthase-like uncharacterized protein
LSAFSSSSVQPVVAFQVWDAVGWVGQALFSLRFVHQWIRSERAKRSHVDETFWWISILATLLLIVYSLHRKDPVFIVGFLVNLFLYARNLQLLRRDEAAPRGSPVLPVLLGLGLFGALTAWSLLTSGKIVSYAHPWIWLAIGFTGQAIWTGRFLVQWYVSERRGRSVLPASFFWIGLLGVPFCFAWAVYRVDWVMMAAYLLNPIPYVRNLILIHRERLAAEA